MRGNPADGFGTTKGLFAATGLGVLEVVVAGLRAPDGGLKIVFFITGVLFFPAGTARTLTSSLMGAVNCL